MAKMHLLSIMYTHCFTFVIEVLFNLSQMFLNLHNVLLNSTISWNTWNRICWKTTLYITYKKCMIWLHCRQLKNNLIVLTCHIRFAWITLSYLDIKCKTFSVNNINWIPLRQLHKDYIILNFTSDCFHTSDLEYDMQNQSL